MSPSVADRGCVEESGGVVSGVEESGRARGANGMNKIEAMRRSLSTEALRALAEAGSPNQGFVPTGYAITPAVLAEFRMRGVVGLRDGLSRIGALLAGRLIEELYDAKF